MTHVGDFPEDFTAVPILFTTHDGNGAPVAPLTAFEAADVTIYKNGATAKATTNGVTMTSPLNSKTGLHAVVIDTSVDTGDTGFWTAGASYSVVLDPDTETVNGQTVRKEIGTFTLAMNLRSTTNGRTLDVTATGAAGVDWGNVENLTTANALTGTTIATTQKVDVDTIKTNPVVNGGTITFPTNKTLAATDNITAGTVTTVSGNVNGSVGSVTGLTASNLDATISSRLAAGSYTAPDNSSITSIKAKTDNLPASPAATGDAMTLTSAYNFAKGTTAMTEAYAANGVAPTPVQALYAIHQTLMQFGISGTSNTVKKLDNTTTAFVVTLDDATNPTGAART